MILERNLVDNEAIYNIILKYYNASNYFKCLQKRNKFNELSLYA